MNQKFISWHDHLTGHNGVRPGGDGGKGIKRGGGWRINRGRGKLKRGGGIKRGGGGN